MDVSNGGREGDVREGRPVSEKVSVGVEEDVHKVHLAAAANWAVSSKSRPISDNQ